MWFPNVMGRLKRGTPFDRSGATEISVASSAEPRRAVYFYRIHAENCITEFCVANWCGPQSVCTYPPGFVPEQFFTWVDKFMGAAHMERRKADMMVQWDSYEEGDLLVFKAPSEDHAGQPIMWHYDRRLQIGCMANRHEMDQFILRGRKSLVVNGLKA